MLYVCLHQRNTCVHDCLARGRARAHRLNQFCRKRFGLEILAAIQLFTGYVGSKYQPMDRLSIHCAHASFVDSPSPLSPMFPMVSSRNANATLCTPLPRSSLDPVSPTRPQLRFSPSPLKLVNAWP